MHTDKYLGLQRRLLKLRRVYLPVAFDPTGSYPEVVLEKVRAYKVLVHAEMEYYFEQVALAIAQKAYKLWLDKRKASTPLLSMVAYYSGSFPAIPDMHSANTSTSDIDWRTKEAFTSYNKYLRVGNHGIKEKNILNIFLPIGIKINEIDNNLLIELNSFGAERGVIAHSSRMGALSLTTPDDALKNVDTIMSYIDSFDQYLYLYKKEMR